MLFDTAMESYMGVAESLDSVMESWEGVEVEPTSRAFAEITREGAEDLARIESAIYVADVLIEGQLVDGVITEEQAQAVAEGAIKDFLSKVVTKLKELFNKVKAWFVAIGKKFKVYTMENKKFISTYESEIKEKAKSDKIKFKCYNYNLDKAVNTQADFDNYVADNLENLCGALTGARDTESWLRVLKDDKKTAIAVDADGNVKDTFWDNCKLGNSWAEVKERIMKDFHDGDVEEHTVKELPIDTMIKALKEGKVEKEIAEGYKLVTSTYNRSIKDLETAQKMYNEKGNEKGKENVAKFVKATASKVSSLTSLCGNSGELCISIYKEFYTASARICKALVTKKPAKESYVDESQAENSGSILESALSFL